MSSNKTLKFIAIYSALAMSCSGCFFQSKSSKTVELNPSFDKIRRTAKLGIGAEAKLSLVTKVEIQKNFELQVDIQRQKSKDNYSFQLQLPDGIELVSGEISGPIVFQDNKARLNYTLKHNSFDNERIGILLVSPSGNKLRFSISSINYQKDIDELNAISKRQEEYLEENPEVLEALENASDGHHD